MHRPWSTLAACGALLFAGAVEAREFTCTVTARGVAHKLTVSFVDERVDSFRYLSITTNAEGYTCDVSASKRNAKSWTLGPDGRTLSVGLDLGTGTPVEATVLDSASTTTFRFLKTRDFEVHRAACGLNGYVAPVISLVKGSGTCRLGSTEEQH